MAVEPLEEGRIKKPREPLNAKSTTISLSLSLSREVSRIVRDGKKETRDSLTRRESQYSAPTVSERSLDNLVLNLTIADISASLRYSAKSISVHHPPEIAIDLLNAFNAKLRETADCLSLSFSPSIPRWSSRTNFSTRTYTTDVYTYPRSQTHARDSRLGAKRSVDN